MKNAAAIFAALDPLIKESYVRGSVNSRKIAKRLAELREAASRKK